MWTLIPDSLIIVFGQYLSQLNFHNILTNITCRISPWMSTSHEFINNLDRLSLAIHGWVLICQTIPGLTFWQICKYSFFNKLYCIDQDFLKYCTVKIASILGTKKNYQSSLRLNSVSNNKLFNSMWRKYN